MPMMKTTTLTTPDATVRSPGRYRHNANNNRSLYPGLPRWAGTRRNIHPFTPLLIINILYQLPPSTMIHNILPVQFTCLTVFLAQPISSPSDHSHLCPLKCHLIFFPYRPGLTSMQHTFHTQLLYSLPLIIIQRRALRIVFPVTVGMPYILALEYAQISSLHTRRVEVNKQFFRSLSNPSNCIFSLLPPPRDRTITSRLRSAGTYPRPITRTKRYTSSIQHFLLHYQ